VKVQHGDDANNARWFDMRELPALAFDHVDVLATVMQHVRRGVLYFLEGLEFFGRTVDLPELRRVHELAIGRTIDGEALERQLLEWGVLRKSHRQIIADGQRLYEIDQARLEQIRREDSLAALQI
jgi:8-oxo-dGTP diphosphatase